MFLALAHHSQVLMLPNPTLVTSADVKDSIDAESAGWDGNLRPFDAQRAAIGDRRFLGGYDARFHSTNRSVEQLCPRLYSQAQTSTLTHKIWRVGPNLHLEDFMKRSVR